MNTRSRTVAVLVGAVVLAGAAGIGVAASGSSSATGATPSMSRPSQVGPQGFDLSALAEELGVSESRLQEALEATMPSGGPGSGGPPPGADGMTPPSTDGTTPSDGATDLS